MIPKVMLTDIYKDTFRRSSLISIPNMSELLQVPNSEFSRWEIFYTIVRDSLNTFEYYYPLARIQKVFLEVDSISRRAKYSPNFGAYLNGVLDEDDITLEIASCQGLAYNGYVNTQWPLRNFRFDNGVFSDFWYSQGTYWANCICKRPFPEIFIRSEKSKGQGQGEAYPDDKCAIYFMQQNIDSTYTIFRDQVYCEVCRYVMNIRKNFALPNMPIELFQGLEEDFNRVDGKLQNIYQQAHKSSYWLI